VYVRMYSSGRVHGCDSQHQSSRDGLQATRGRGRGNRYTVGGQHQHENGI